MMFVHRGSQNQIKKFLIAALILTFLRLIHFIVLSIYIGATASLACFDLCLNAGLLHVVEHFYIVVTSIGIGI